MAIEVSWAQVLGWRLRRHGLQQLSGEAADGIVGRLCGVQAQVPSAAALAVAVRQREPDIGAVDAALGDGRLVRTWAMRGTLHVMRPEEAVAFLPLVAAARSWEKGSWVRVFGPTPEEMRELVEVVPDILDGRVLTREELVGEIGERLKKPELEQELRSGWGTLLKPVAWQGGIVHGPSQGNKVTFTRPTFGPLPEPEEAAATAIPAYLRAYGPASPKTFDAYLTRGLNKKAAPRRWFASLGDDLATVEVEGEELSLMAEDVDDLAGTKPSDVVRLLPAFDQWVLGPGTNATPIVPAEHRKDVSRTAGRISPVVIHGGRVVGVWDRTDDAVDVRLFAGEKGRLTPAALKAEQARVGALVSVP